MKKVQKITYNEDGSIYCIDEYYPDHAYKVWKTKGANDSIIMLDDPIIGKTFKHNKKIATVEEVYRQWYGGYFDSILYSVPYKKIDGTIEKSHGTIIFRNINCIDPIILDSIEPITFI